MVAIGSGIFMTPAEIAVRVPFTRAYVLSLFQEKKSREMIQGILIKLIGTQRIDAKYSPLSRISSSPSS